MKPLLLLLLLSLVAVAACAGPAGTRMSYANVQALNPGVSADWVQAEFPFGRTARRPDGSIESITYNVQDPQGRGQTLQLVFDPSGRMTEKRYSGAVVRPGGAQGGPTTR